MFLLPKSNMEIIDFLVAAMRGYFEGSDRMVMIPFLRFKGKNRNDVNTDLERG